MPLLLLLSGTGATSHTIAHTSRTFTVPALPSGAKKLSKDPADNLDYTWNWARWLDEDDTIAVYTVTGGGLTVGAISADDTSVTAWLSGGTAETPYTTTCRITTAAGRVKDASIILYVREF